MRLGDSTCWIVLTTFERHGGSQQILPASAHGACGWLAVFAETEDEARSLIRLALEHDGCKVVEFDDMRSVADLDDIREVDEHLASNVVNIEAGKNVVWGTIHCYYAEGEA